jgi:hypothetical protein
MLVSISSALIICGPPFVPRQPELTLFAAILIQRIVYGAKPPPEVLPDDEDVEQALRLDSDME